MGGLTAGGARADGRAWVRGGALVGNRRSRGDGATPADTNRWAELLEPRQLLSASPTPRPATTLAVAVAPAKAVMAARAAVPWTTPRLVAVTPVVSPAETPSAAGPARSAPGPATPTAVDADRHHTFPELARLGQPGSQAYAGSVTAAWPAYGDGSDIWTIPLAAGQIVTVVARGSGPYNDRPYLRLSNSKGEIVASGAAALDNTPDTIIQSYVVPPGWNDPSGDTYSVDVMGLSPPIGTRQYELSVYVNAAAEAEGWWGPANDTGATAQDIDGAFRALGGSAAVAAVAGSGQVRRNTAAVGDDFESGWLGPAWQVPYHYPQGRIAPYAADGTPARHGGYALFMDADPSAGGDPQTTEAIWMTNPSAVGHPVLTFGHFSREAVPYSLPETFVGSVPGDGVSASVDGYHWFRVWDPVDSGPEWADASVDLAALYRANGWPSTLQLQVKFQQDGTSSFGQGGGRGWDDVAIVDSSLLADQFAFTLAQGEVVSLGASGAAAVGSLSLLGPGGQPLATGTAGGGTGYDLVVDRFVAPAAGTYYAAANGFGGSYALVVAKGAALESEPNDQLVQASATGSAKTVVGSIAGPSDRDGYRFAATAGVPVVIGTTTPGGGAVPVAGRLDPTVGIYDASDGTYAAGDWGGAADGRNVGFTFVPPRTGDYVAFVSGEGSTAGDYALAIAGLPPVPAPGRPDLDAHSDSGASDADDVTRNNNAASTGRPLSFRVSGATPYADLRLYVDGVLAGSGTAWPTVDPTYALAVREGYAVADGTHVVTARQVLPGETRESADSLPLAVTIDTVAPAKPPPPKLAAARDTGVSDSDGLTSNLFPQFAVTAGPYARVFRNYVRVSGEYGGGTYTAAAADPPYADVYYWATAVDAAGNESEPSDLAQLRFDVTAPEAGTAYAAEAVTAVGSTEPARFEVRYDDNTGLDAVAVAATPVRVTGPAGYDRVLSAASFDPPSPPAPDPSWTWRGMMTYALPAPAGGWTAANHGTYSVRPAAAGPVRDAAGNPAPATSYGTFRLSAISGPDLHAPSDSGVSATDNLTAFDNSSYAKAPQFVVTGAMFHAIVELFADGVPIGLAAGDPFGTPGVSGTTYIQGDGVTRLADGPHVITVRQTNDGVPSPMSQPLTITVDTTGPSVTGWRAAAAPAGGGGEVAFAMPAGGSYVDSRAGGARTLLLDLSEAVDPASVLPSAVRLSGTDRDGKPVDLSGVAITTAVRTGGANPVLAVSFGDSLLDRARYSVRVKGLRDLAGNPLVGSVSRNFALLRGDIDGDGAVGFADFNLLAAQYGKSVSPWSKGDLDGDGSVGFADFNLLAAQYGKTLAPAS